MPPERKWREGHDSTPAGEVGAPTVAVVGESSIIDELGQCRLVAADGGAGRVMADVILIEADSRVDPLAWAVRNPRTPVLLVNARHLQGVIFGHCQSMPLVDAQLLDPLKFIEGVIQAARQLEPAGSSPQSGIGLTMREREVLAAFASGRRSGFIATELGIAENTVRQHLTNARRKLNAPDRITAVLKAIGYGLIPVPRLD